MAKLHFLYSVMNAGKTTHLLQVRYNYIENGGHVLLFTSVIDDRFGIGKVKSRLGLEADAIPLRKEDAIHDVVAAEHARRPVTAWSLLMRPTASSGATGLPARWSCCRGTATWSSPAP